MNNNEKKFKHLKLDDRIVSHTNFRSGSTVEVTSGIHV